MATRRQFVFALGAGALAGPLASFAQEPGKVWRIGILAPFSQTAAQGGNRFGSFIAGMRELGYVEGRNIAIDWRFADGVYNRLPELAAELAKLKVDVIVTVGTNGIRASQRATHSIPIVVTGAIDPVGSGLIASLSRPGGNITGMSNLDEDIYPKRLEMLSIAAPNAGRIAMLLNPNSPTIQTIIPGLIAAGKKLNRQIQIVNASTISELKDSFVEMAREHVEALLVANDSFLNEHVVQIAELAAKQKLPSIHSIREYAEAGGLMSYGRVRLHAGPAVTAIRFGGAP